MKNGWLTGIPAIAEFIGVHPDTLRKRWMKAFSLPLVKIRGRWCANPDILNKWLELASKNKQSPKP